MLRIEQKIYFFKKWYQDLIPKRMTPKNSNRPTIIGWLGHIFYFTKKEYDDQKTFIYCPVCHLELISTNSFVKENSDGLCEFRCSECGEESLWDFDTPVPILIKGGTYERK